MKFRFTIDHATGTRTTNEGSIITKDLTISINEANALLEAEEKKCERVYGVETTAVGETWIVWNKGLKPPIKGPNPNNFPEATHTALLWNVEPIKENIVSDVEPEVEKIDAIEEIEK